MKMGYQILGSKHHSKPHKYFITGFRKYTHLTLECIGSIVQKSASRFVQVSEKQLYHLNIKHSKWPKGCFGWKY